MSPAGLQLPARLAHGQRPTLARELSALPTSLLFLARERAAPAVAIASRGGGGGGGGGGREGGGHFGEASEAAAAVRWY